MIFFLMLKIETYRQAEFSTSLFGDVESTLAYAKNIRKITEITNLK